MTANDWKSKGEFITVNDRKLFVIDTSSFFSSDNKIPTETMVILHGYPTSSYDYS